MTAPRHIDCPACNGTGDKSLEGFDTTERCFYTRGVERYGCTECGGHGVIDNPDLPKVFPHFNPVTGKGFHACDDNGNHGFGNTEAQALSDYEAKREVA
jgi:hypothetical protein